MPKANSWYLGSLRRLAGGHIQESLDHSSGMSKPVQLYLHLWGEAACQVGIALIFFHILGNVV